MASSECGVLKEEENDDLAVIVAGDVEGVELMVAGRQGETGQCLLGTPKASRRFNNHSRFRHSSRKRL